MIDPHVHARDGKQSYKETIGHVFHIAAAQGVTTIFDMPNTDPPILYERDVRARLTLVPREYLPHYFLYMGASADPVQLREAVACYRTMRAVVGFKMYAGRSTGNLAVLEEDAQRLVYRELAALDYRGVLAVHCEKESLMKSGFDPEDPVSHARNRPPKAEVQSVKDQIAFAREAGFKGILHIAHISTPEAVALVAEARATMRITCGTTPHHLLWDDSKLKGTGGLFYKCNPPLRDAPRVRALRKLFAEGAIDWIETDHAPHTFEEKFMPPYASGYPALYLYGYVRDVLMPQLGMDKKAIRAVTYGNIVKAFKNKLQS